MLSNISRTQVAVRSASQTFPVSLADIVTECSVQHNILAQYEHYAGTNAERRLDSECHKGQGSHSPSSTAGILNHRNSNKTEKHWSQQKKRITVRVRSLGGGGAGRSEVIATRHIAWRGEKNISLIHRRGPFNSKRTSSLHSGRCGSPPARVASAQCVFV
jgi:hypothetical protein